MFRRITGAALAFAAFTLFISESSAELVKGVIKDLDVDTGTIRLFVGGKGADVKIVKGKVAGGNPGGEPQSFNLKAPNIPVLSADGKKAKLTDLTPGVPVTLELSVDEDVETIVAGASVRAGPLLALDMDKKQVTLGGGKKREDATYSFADDAAVTVYGQKRTLKELSLGQHLLLVMSLDQKSVVSIVAGLKLTSEDPRGAVVGVDAVGHSITLLSGRDGRFRFVTWPVAGDVRILFNEAERPEMKLTDLPVPTRVADLTRTAPVWLRLAPDQKAVAVIVIEPVIMQAVVESIDAAKRTLVVRVADGKTETFTLEANADVRIGGKLASLESYTPGASVMLTLAFEPGRLIAVRARKE